jgi:hypothetical protein
MTHKKTPKQIYTTYKTSLYYQIKHARSNLIIRTKQAKEINYFFQTPDIMVPMNAGDPLDSVSFLMSETTLE